MQMKQMIKTYYELLTFPTFDERFEYLKLKGSVGIDTFGFDRIFNQQFYRSSEWKSIRNLVIARDRGCDLGVEGYEIPDRILIHHMNPISVEDIQHSTEFLLNPNYLICVSHQTHNALHYGKDREPEREYKPRRLNDTCPWKR